VITDSGTVQEECCILKVRCATIRDTTERPETVECDSNVLSCMQTDSVWRYVNAALTQGTDWIPPEEYLVPNVSDTVIKILFGIK